MASNKMWGGRFDASPDEIMEEINASIGVDQRFASQDIAGSRAHCEMLAQTGIITRADADKILDGLNTIASELKNGEFPFRREFEDIHLNVEARLRELIGEPAGRLHTARSRNDQVATDFRLWVRDAIDELDLGLAALQQAFVDQAAKNIDTIMPGFTHLQSAQPVTFAHHCLAYVEMFDRDRGRFADARARLNESPLGAAALAGTSFPIDRDATTAALGFDRPMRNSLDAVSDRDFVLETLAAAAITAGHLSRIAEEIVIWSSAQFDFVSLPDGLTTGSSIMPQKRNPDAAELVRAKTGRVNGALVSLLTMMKGLPLAYSKDMQEDKEPTFDAIDSLAISITAMTAMIGRIVANSAAMAAAAGVGFSTATDLADWLVRALKIPFRDAHHITGVLVSKAEAAKIELHELALADMQAVEPRITADVLNFLSTKNSVRSRTSEGGAAPSEAKKKVAFWRKKLKEGRDK
jgi:argininosuccinate lyase